jgi:hypothetical protein
VAVVAEEMVNLLMAMGIDLVSLAGDVAQQMNRLLALLFNSFLSLGPALWCGAVGPWAPPQVQGSVPQWVSCLNQAASCSLQTATAQQW